MTHNTSPLRKFAILSETGALLALTVRLVFVARGAAIPLFVLRAPGHFFS
jgi:hypothetical protein